MSQVNPDLEIPEGIEEVYLGKGVYRIKLPLPESVKSIKGLCKDESIIGFGKNE